MQQLRENFPHINIQNDWISYSAYVDTIALQAATGELSDLHFCNAFNDMPLMVQNDLLLETDDLLEEYGQNILAATPEVAWGASEYHGSHYAIAHNIYDLNIWGTTYRKDWLDSLGLEIPETLDEYREVLNVFTHDNPAATTTYGRCFFPSIRFDDDLFHAFDVAVGHHGNGFWRTRGDRVELDWVQPEMKDAWEWLAELWNDRVIDPESMTAQIQHRANQWNAAIIGNQYGAWTGLDTQVLELRKIEPEADIVGGPALKGPNGHQGFTGEGFPWVYVIPRTCEHPEIATQIIDWFMAPEQAARFTCEGEIGYTLKGLNDQGWCEEYTLEEKREMGDEWSERVNDAQDIVAYGGVWLPLGGTAIRPWLLETMPPDMQEHFENILENRYSDNALEAQEYAEEYMKLTEKPRPTASEQDLWPSLQSRFLEIMSQAVSGSLQLDQGWDDWIAYWENNGGPTLTDEVNEIV
jgi:ABC-type glycerol-3-phosphate transport system substrate-binding protein